MKIKKYFHELRYVLDDYYNGADYGYCCDKISELVKKAKEAGLDVNTNSDILDTITPFTLNDNNDDDFYCDDYDDYE
jgi:hypothetical protein